MIVENLRLIFIHIPKNAGSSIEAAYGRIWRPRATRPNEDWPEIFARHCPAVRYAKRFEGYSSYRSFAIVRNPWDRLVSAYEYEKKMALKGSGLQSSNRQLLASGIDFREYVLRADFDTVFMGPQLPWVVDDDANMIVDRIIRYENLQSELLEYFNSLDLPPLDLPHLNQSKRRDYTEYYDDELVGLVGDAYKADIDQFGYKYTC